ncbi:MetQ/NlpA family ABC transporter substrate-binding protein [Rhizobiaceae bacterium BDR2-2]|uniref:MetQ/NlpA family ABC transporter substrate-binding protein n=1 Tax=Ectorhizobium quercum TaxID=2965071 RepID=A0AAE3SUU9_9HYPH|nr:MetQ/NlpA family ABC transporter substrate-binding protein [Ectorhizobium quercum]MCX8997492.1 MetQ/NlpA family ABC transporter substrate-binding protein [Ectorhizobium quercum]
MFNTHHAGKGRRVFAAIAATLFTAVGAMAPAGPLLAASVPGEPLSIYVTPTPQGDILRYVQKLADEDGSGLKLKVIESSQGLDSNQLVFKGDVDANLIQHVPYFDSWIAAHPEAKDSLVNVATVLVNIFGLYSSKYESAKDIPEGASILVPNEQTNLPRALFILQDEGLLKLAHPKSDGTPEAVSIDEKQIVDNPRQFRFVPTETGLRAKSLPDVQASFINGDIALTHGIDPASALSLESPQDNPYANVLTTRRELVNDPRIQLLVDYLTGEKVAKYIEENYKGFIVPAQERLAISQ